jgi:uncharacterized protein (DUF934 family)
MSEPTPLFAPMKPAVLAARLWTPAGFADDTWTGVSDDAEIASADKVIVSRDRWRREAAALVRHGGDLGIRVHPGDGLDVTTDDIGSLAMIVLTFPKFSDGRAYSTACQLREAGYTGALRATGDVLFDQLPLMLRAGFDVFEIVDAATLRALVQRQHPAVLPAYQRAAVG